MKAVMVAVAVLLALGGVVSDSSRAAGAAAPSLESRISGAWELVWPEMGPGEREVKLIVGHHFSWSTYRPESHEALASGGGTWSLVGAQYCEQLLHADGGAEPLRGRIMCFDVEVHGDTLVQVYQPDGNGMRTREVWKRLR